MTNQPVSKDIFRAYDIRGIVGEGLDAEIVTLVGKAVATEALEMGESTLVVGADARLSSPEFKRALINGILSTGCNATDIGTVPTPLLYFATHTTGSTSGIMITGSHNPKNYNGIKMVLKNQCLAADQITRIRERIDIENFRSGSGKTQQSDVLPAYIKRICSDIQYSKPFRVVIDCGNAVAGYCAPMLFSALGCEVISLYCEPDGHFPNHHPDPTRHENLTDLIASVGEHGADLGIAFDGDGDRVGLVSSSGKIIDADSMMLAFIDDILPDYPDASIIFDVKSSQQLPRLIRKHQGRPIMCKSGHSFVKQEMQATGALLGGEYSSHIFFRHRWFGFDDGLYTAARYLELMDKQQCSADELLARQPLSFSTPELQVAVSEEKKFETMAMLQKNLDIPGATINRLDGIRAEAENAWGLVRASNTTPNLILRFEADTAEALEQVQTLFREAITALAPELKLGF